MATRQPVQSGLKGGISINPVSQRVDAFAGASGGASPELQGLAEGLGTFSASVANLAQTLGIRKATRDKAAGALAVRTELQELAAAGKSAREAIELGTITADQSPWFRQGAEEQFGLSSADKFFGELLVAFGNSEVGDSTDIADFDTFAAQFMKQWAAQNLPTKRSAAFEAGFAQVDSKINSLRDQVARKAGENLIRFNRDSFGSSLIAGLRQGTVAGKSVEELAAEIQASLDIQIAQGMNKTTANDVTAEAILRFAESINDPTIIRPLLETIKAGKNTLFDRTSVIDAAIATEEKINQRRAAKDQAQRAQEAALLQKAEEDIYDAATEVILGNPGADLSPFVSRLRALNNSEVSIKNLLSLGERLRESSFQGNPAVENSILSAIVDVTDPSSPGFITRGRLAGALRARSIGQSVFTTALNLLQERDAEGGKQDSEKVITHPLFTNMRSVLKSSYGGSEFLPVKDPEPFRRALAEFTDEWIQWRENQGKNASLQEINEFLSNTARAKRQRFPSFDDKSLGDAATKLFSGALPEARLNQNWRLQPLETISRSDWVNVANQFVRGAFAVDSLPESILHEAWKVGVQDSLEINDFVIAQLRLNGLIR